MRQAHFSYSLVFVLVAACGGDSKPATVDGPSGGGDTDAQPGADASIDTPPGSMITVSGTATERTLNGTAVVSGATIAAYRNGDDATAVATTTSNAQGEFSLAVPATGGPLDGYLKATKANLKDAYLYPPAPISANITAPVNMVSQGTWDTLVTIAIGKDMQTAGNGLVALIVVSGTTADSTPVQGAVVTSVPASTVRYNNGILPNGTTSTAADGTAYLFNVAASGSVTVSAKKGGTTYASHGLKAWPDQLTTTIIIP